LCNADRLFFLKKNKKNNSIPDIFIFQTQILCVDDFSLFVLSLQVNPAKYTGLMSGLRTIISEEGAMAVWKGWAPTAIGYSMQGLFKFGLYEFFKDYYSTLAGKDKAYEYRKIIWLAGSASAEFFAGSRFYFFYFKKKPSYIIQT
jgi:hypothetical protein